jgi:hypothetical protein
MNEILEQMQEASPVRKVKNHPKNDEEKPQTSSDRGGFSKTPKNEVTMDMEGILPLDSSS